MNHPNEFNSKFTEFQEKKRAKIQNKVSNLLNKKSKINSEQLKDSIKYTDDIIQTYRQQLLNEINNIVVHIDMDAFFCSCEEQIRPEINWKITPMAVGSYSMLSTANYKAREFGVKSAMPGFMALKLCPNLMILEPNFKLYQQKSEEVMNVLRQFNQTLHVVGLDECFLSLNEYIEKHEQSSKFSGANSFHNEIFNMVTKIRCSVFESTGLTCSAGIGPNYLLAKIFSDINKPNGQFQLVADEQSYLESHYLELIESFMRNLDVRKIPGIGMVTENILKGLSLNTCGDIYLNRHWIPILFDKSSSLCSFLLRSSIGIGHAVFSHRDPNSVESSYVDDSVHNQKSLSMERTFQSTNDINFLSDILKELVESIIERIKSQNIKSSTITIKIKLDDFQLVTRARTLNYSTDDPTILFETAYLLLKQHFNLMKNKIRLLGIRLSSFSNDKSVKKNNILPYLDIQDYFLNNQLKDQDMSSFSTIDKNLWICPICSEQFPLDCCDEFCLKSINEHLDKCLSFEEIKRINRYEDMLEIKSDKVIKVSTNPTNTPKNLFPSKKANKCQSHTIKHFFS